MESTGKTGVGRNALFRIYIYIYMHSGLAMLSRAHSAAMKMRASLSDALFREKCSEYRARREYPGYLQGCTRVYAERFFYTGAFLPRSRKPQLLLLALGWGQLYCPFGRDLAARSRIVKFARDFYARKSGIRGFS